MFIESDKDMNLKNLGVLLGFTKNKVIQTQKLRMILWLTSTVDYIIYQYAVML